MDAISLECFRALAGIAANTNISEPTKSKAEKLMGDFMELMKQHCSLVSQAMTEISAKQSGIQLNA